MMHAHLVCLQFHNSLSLIAGARVLCTVMVMQNFAHVAHHVVSALQNIIYLCNLKTEFATWGGGGLGVVASFWQHASCASAHISLSRPWQARLGGGVLIEKHEGTCATHYKCTKNNHVEMK